jgi:predicted negative regulator of RcsB-dependent stress response
MKAPPPLDAWPVSSDAHSFDELEEIRARLARAQQAENEAIRKLNRLNAQNCANRAESRRLLAEAKAAKDRCVEAYARWEAAVQRFKNQNP